MKNKIIIERSSKLSKEIDELIDIYWKESKIDIEQLVNLLLHNKFYKKSLY